MRDLITDSLDHTRSAQIGNYTLYESMRGHVVVVDDTTDTTTFIGRNWNHAVLYAKCHCPLYRKHLLKDAELPAQ